MLDSTEQLLCIEEFSQKTSRSPQEIVASLERGLLSGRKIRDQWYVDAGQVDATSTHCRSEAEVLMCAAAATDWRRVLWPIDARRKAVFKAPSLELGISVAAVQGEAERARGRAFAIDFLIGIASLFGIVAVIELWSSGPDSQFDAAGDASSSPTLMLLSVLAVIATADFIGRRLAKRRAREILSTHASRRNYDAADCVRGEPNVIVSGGYSPFVGAGGSAGGWSFTMNLAQAADANLPVQGATANALYQEAENAVRVLGVSDLVIRDEVYVDGRDVREVAEFMTSGPFHSPLGTLAASQMTRHVGNDDDRTRHYVAIRCMLWEGQVVLSTFLRYVVVENVLFVEARSFVLPPLAKRFLDLKNLPLLPQFSERVGDLVLSSLRATYIWIPILSRALNFVQGGFLDSRRRWLKRSTKEVLANQRYNYGWDKSLREVWAGTDYERYFQMVDLDFYKKLVQESLLDSLLLSLQKRNICTESLKSATTTIHNEGVIVNGGSLQAENLTAGRSSTIRHFVRGAQGRGRESRRMT